eukprot:GDKI01005624.1.p2 GENE.GDKI01005624.1~~GDKI01005624.1.p2  ORF type:complete len:144 (-),score=37.74 GDKI01005624.1:693-1124(-)
MASVQMDPLDPSQRFAEHAKQEIGLIEKELKDWFLNRRICMERNIALKKTLDARNTTGLSINNPNLPDAQRVMWTDLVNGRPELEDQLSVDAREMKADKYLQMFKEATDLDHPCRIPGRCRAADPLVMPRTCLSVVRSVGLLA